MNTPAETSVNQSPAPSRTRLLEIQRHIVLLKCIRKKTLALRSLSADYNSSLAGAFVEPLHQTESALAHLLLERELWLGDNA